MSNEILEPIPNQFNSSCFGCSTDNPVGLQMSFKAGKDKVVSEVMVPQHLCGWNNLVHGGVLTTILDEIMSWTAIHFLKKLVMTKNLNVSFHKSVMVGDSIKAVGRIKKEHNRHEVLMEGVLLDNNDKKCVTAEAVFALLPSKVANRLGISEEEYPDWLK